MGGDRSAIGGDGRTPGFVEEQHSRPVLSLIVRRRSERPLGGHACFYAGAKLCRLSPPFKAPGITPPEPILPPPRG